MNTIALVKTVEVSLARFVGKMQRTADIERTVEIKVENPEHVSREIRHLRYSARDLRRQIPAFDEQIFSRRGRTKRLMALSDTLCSSVFAMGAATAVAGGASSTHQWLSFGAYAMISGVGGAVVAGLIATSWELYTEALIKRRSKLLHRAARYDTMARAIDTKKHLPTDITSIARVEVVGGESHHTMVVSQ